MTSATLELDATSLKPEDLSREALMRELNLQQRPSWLLSKFMNALESKRAAKGLGWSRPWNKYGLTVFRTHTHELETDASYLLAVGELIYEAIAGLPVEYRLFAEELITDPNRKVFTFYHNNQDATGEYEGLTISIGRKVPHDPSKRDRIDLILEDQRINEKVDGQIDRIRLYINPWIEYQHKNYELIELNAPSDPIPTPFQQLYQSSTNLYDRWKQDQARQWAHWSTKYIEYFGPRSFIPHGSSFR